jgi:hypothetical protein
MNAWEREKLFPREIPLNRILITSGKNSLN